VVVNTMRRGLLSRGDFDTRLLLPDRRPGTPLDQVPAAKLPRYHSGVGHFTCLSVPRTTLRALTLQLSFGLGAGSACGRVVERDLPGSCAAPPLMQGWLAVVPRQENSCVRW